MINYLWDNLFKKSEDAVFKAISNNIIFEGLSRSELKTVVDFLHVRHYRHGELIFRQNEIGVGMYIILKGKVDIFIEKANNTSKEPKDEFITRLEENDIMGEISLIEENSRRTASAKALVEVQLIGFFQPDLQNLLKSNPEIGSKILLKLSQILGRRLAETARKISELKKQIDSLKA